MPRSGSGRTHFLRRNVDDVGVRRMEPDARNLLRSATRRRSRPAAVRRLEHSSPRETCRGWRPRPSHVDDMGFDSLTPDRPDRTAEVLSVAGSQVLPPSSGLEDYAGRPSPIQFSRGGPSSGHGYRPAAAENPISRHFTRLTRSSRTESRLGEEDEPRNRGRERGGVSGHGGSSG